MPLGMMRKTREGKAREDLTPEEIRREKVMGALGCLLYLLAAAVLVTVFVLHLVRPDAP